MSAAEQVDLTGAKPASSLASRSAANTAQYTVGMRVFESKPPHHVWVIRKIYTPSASSLPHVLLDRCGKFPASKLISLQTLMDSAHFKKDRRNPFANNDKPMKLRRRTDPTKTVL